MKQETVEEIIQKQTREKSSDLEVLNINFFYKLFLKEKKSYDPSLFCIGKKTRKKRKRKVTIKEYRKVIYTYLKIYFYELYLLKKPMYFFFGGFMKIVLYPTWKRLQKRGFNKKEELHESERAFGLFWYMRPTKRYHFMIKLVKLTGKTNMIPKIESVFTRAEDKDLLPIFGEEWERAKQNKTLYRCIQR